MPGKFVINLTRAKDDPDRATVAFVVANAAVASDKKSMVFLSTEGVRLAQAGYADDIHEELHGFERFNDEFRQRWRRNLCLLAVLQKAQT